MEDVEYEESVPQKLVNENGTDIYVLLVVLAVIALGVFIYWKFVKTFDSRNRSSIPFDPPPDREAYFKACDQCDFEDPNQLEELRKLLMRRAIATIPIVLALQNEGHAIEKLYKRGMLTDDMHYKVKEMKAFVDQEIPEVQMEASNLVEGWGEGIWPQAFRFHQMMQQRSTSAEQEEDEKKQAAAEKRKERLKKQKELSAARKKKESAERAVIEEKEKAERIARELIEEEQAAKSAKSKLK
mmetsp:Transcript_16540/g.16646  ORF Transcript_16540/g.16646 Transcript_16540/m.16646 type:complete len:241 (-) Transcript_16540:142-864(-)|eukprot:CAMPEP_0182424128 /NCGR_PEP_ID=MMETSP1167-20130531/10283_1 /TAXON_ID=2988 /ORGANISM="Mallomonas Sp, Strain CCMP3275" /LENGTH=240 /DNA_ID=CAMNT_0024603687 /DNA_START=98 /DNA_END=820 /DNA_ORIENTATION=+